MENLMSVKQLASLLGISRATLYEWCSDRQIPHLKVGRRTAFDPKQIEQWLANRKIEEEKTATGTQNETQANGGSPV
jgi:excisionase family DNA binding protein